MAVTVSEARGPEVVSRVGRHAGCRCLSRALRAPVPPRPAGGSERGSGPGRTLGTARRPRHRGSSRGDVLAAEVAVRPLAWRTELSLGTLNLSLESPAGESRTHEPDTSAVFYLFVNGSHTRCKMSQAGVCAHSQLPAAARGGSRPGASRVRILLHAPWVAGRSGTPGPHHGHL